MWAVSGGKEPAQERLDLLGRNWSGNLYPVSLEAAAVDLTIPRGHPSSMSRALLNALSSGDTSLPEPEEGQVGGRASKEPETRTVHPGSERLWMPR